jgi:hypothetical protein
VLWCLTAAAVRGDEGNPGPRSRWVRRLSEGHFLQQHLFCLHSCSTYCVPIVHLACSKAGASRVLSGFDPRSFLLSGDQQLNGTAVPRSQKQQREEKANT